MYCEKCRVRIPFDKAPDLKQCGICGAEFTPDSRDILEFKKFDVVSEVRPSQVAMATDIETLLSQDKGVLVAEGGTGIGKSFAYLIPALLAADKRIVISTAKKGLQDQLVTKDIPLLIKQGVAQGTTSYGVYKGKSNYACWKLAAEVPATDRAQFKRLITTAKKLKKPADISGWNGPAPFWWSKVSIENCPLGNRCTHYQQCRPHPKNNRIVVTNHHLTAIDLMIGVGSLFGPYNILILDEAHQAPDAFRSAFAKSITAKRIARLKGTITSDEHLRSAIDDSGVARSKEIIDAFTELEKEFGSIHKKAMHAADDNKTTNVEQLHSELGDFQEMAESVVSQLFLLWEDLTRSLKDAEASPTKGDRSPDQILAMVGRVARLNHQTTALVETTNCLLGDPNNPSPTEYLTTCDDKGIYTQPLDIGSTIAGSLGKVPHKVMLSATLAMGDSFEFTKNRLGIADAQRNTEEPLVEKKYLSPFDLRQQAILYIPDHLPLPAHAGNPDARQKWISAVSTEIAQLLTATKGDALVLFTAKTDMFDIVEELGEDFWEDAKLKLVVHEGDATAAFQQYMDTSHSVLFGLKSFWEGVDIPGNKLKQVIIPKLPFPNPKNPLIAALSDKAGSNSFQEVMIPHMVFDMKQGVGRLIRTQSDQGFVVILDSRIWTGTSNRTTHMQRMERIKADKNHRRMGYGRQLLDILGFVNVTRRFTTVQKYAKKFFNPD